MKHICILYLLIIESLLGQIGPMIEVRANLLSLPAGNLQQSPLIIDFDSSSAWTPGTNPGRDRIRLNGGAYNSNGGFNPPEHGDKNSSDPNYPYSNIVHRFDPIGNAPPITTVPIPMALGSEFIRDLILNRQSFPATAGTYQYTFTFTVTHTYNGTPTTLTGTSIVILRTDGGGGGGGGGGGRGATSTAEPIYAKMAYTKD